MQWENIKGQIIWSIIKLLGAKPFPWTKYLDLVWEWKKCFNVNYTLPIDPIVDIHLFPDDQLRGASQPGKRWRRVCDLPVRGRRYQAQGQGPHDGGGLRVRAANRRRQDSAKEIRSGTTLFLLHRGSTMMIPGNDNEDDIVVHTIARFPDIYPVITNKATKASRRKEKTDTK